MLLGDAVHTIPYRWNGSASHGPQSHFAAGRSFTFSFKIIHTKKSGLQKNDDTARG
jgi:hypothetical protein